MSYKTVEDVINTWLKTKPEDYQKLVKQCDLWEPARFEYYEIIGWLLSQINNSGVGINGILKNCQKSKKEKKKNERK